MSDTPYYIAINRKIRRAFIILTVIFFLILCGFASVAIANRNRVDEIQENRVRSCEAVYDGIREVFQPFFPDKPRTKEETENIRKFNETITKFRARCEEQTRPD